MWYYIVFDGVVWCGIDTIEFDDGIIWFCIASCFAVVYGIALCLMVVSSIALFDGGV